MQFILPEDLIRHIAVFAIPYGKEVRLSWNDDESQCDALLKAIANKNTTKDEISRS
jgi:hypothetical protein